MKRGFGFRAGTLFFPVGIVDKNLYPIFYSPKTSKPFCTLA